MQRTHGGGGEGRGAKDKSKGIAAADKAQGVKVSVTMGANWQSWGLT